MNERKSFISNRNKDFWIELSISFETRSKIF
jgi:hypothetical protein